MTSDRIRDATHRPRGVKMLRPTCLLISLLLLHPATGLRGQNLALEEGTFVLTLNGREIGTETFSIRRSGAGEEVRVIAQGVVELMLPEGFRSMAPALEAMGPALSLTNYQLKVSGDVQREVYVRLNGRRFMATTRTESGEQMREFRAGPGSLLLEDDVAHQYFLLGPYLDQESATLSVLIPRRGRQVRMRLVRLGPEDLETTDGSVIRARHFRLEAGEDSREVWFDEQGRVLRVARPDSGFLAELQELR